MLRLVPMMPCCRWKLRKDLVDQGFKAIECLMDTLWVHEMGSQCGGDGVPGPERRTSHLLTFSLLLWDHRRRLWERLANLAISSRISSCRVEKRREEGGTEFSVEKKGIFILSHTKLEVGFAPGFCLCEGPSHAA